MLDTAQVPGGPPVTPGSAPAPRFDDGAPLAAPQLAAWRGLLMVHSGLTEQLERELRAAQDLPLTWYDVLVQLSEAEDRQLRMQQLAERVLLSKSGLTRLIDRMEREGLVTRTPCADDRRGTWATMTDAGYERIRDAAPVHLTGVREHFGDLVDDAEAELLAAVFDRVLRQLATHRGTR